MSDAREAILKRLAAQRRPEVPPPQRDHAWITFDDPLQQFRAVLESVGGQLMNAVDESDAARQLAELPVIQQAKLIASTNEALLAGNIDLAAVEDPHDLAPVDLALCPADFWVAENGALWVTQRAIRHRVLLFLTQHLVLVVRRSEGVCNMHQAYQRVGDLPDTFGVFISGPSKTADIEQSLVIGAHGARSLHVVMLD